ncbi:hypothetical protein Q765_13615 [Flavobacterium rivuli WB 3.3-2 = DSM 21788]|uniref:Uncharacterized protein n=1 Tax=Flavobacterium rivuli WB 3.3-2 = DSM 21788 TaxID=1121895 RepID=A0A0A2LZR1_9FLAO|nr:hypothetical protein Q765_13615 [Flavobacterium rivuli WB 3.3-2 = DSM 21788]
MSAKIPVFIRLVLEIIPIPPVPIPNGAYNSYSILETLIPCTSQFYVVPEQLRAKSIYKRVGDTKSPFIVGH